MNFFKNLQRIQILEALFSFLGCGGVWGGGGGGRREGGRQAWGRCWQVNFFFKSKEKNWGGGGMEVRNFLSNLLGAG